jgi:thermitase
MKCNYLVWSVIIPLICLAWAGAYSATVSPLVRIDGDRLTLHAKDQRLSTILTLLSDQGIRIRIDPRINPTISARFDNRPIGSAMSSILKSVDYALIWRTNKNADSSEPRLWEIRIFYKGHEERIRPLRKRANLTIVKTDAGDRYVKDILLLRLGPQMTEEKLAVLLDRLGATIIDFYAPLGIVRLRLPHGSDVAAIADSVADTPGITRAEPDYAYPLEGGRRASSDPGSSSASALQSPPAGDAVVAVMDSGLQPGYAGYPYIRATHDAVSPGAEPGDMLGHGTQMTLIAAGAVTPLGAETDPATGSPVVAIRTFDDNGFTSTFTLMRSIDYAVESGARVASLSWGTETASTLLEAAMDYAADKGVVLVAAAGNTPTGNPVYPAAYDNVIGVGALNPDGKAWDQSNYGDFVAVSAPGLANLPVGYNGDPGVYAGTSIATAYTARRVAAILTSNPDADRATILKTLSGGK